MQESFEFFFFRSMQQKYTIATEARNNLIAAIQNLQSCQKYLDNIDFPYCKPKEVTTLEKATNNIYIDMQSPDRHKHAGECYSVTHRRAAALLQWFDNVWVFNNSSTLFTIVWYCVSLTWCLFFKLMKVLEARLCMLYAIETHNNMILDSVMCGQLSNIGLICIPCIVSPRITVVWNMLYET